MRLPDPSGTRVLLFGSSTYDDPDLLSLPAVDRNLADLAALFADPAYCGIPAERVEVEPAPALPAVGRRIDELARTAEDTLIVYYAGHGIPSDRGKLYLSLPITAPDAPHWTAIDFELIRAAMAGSSARNRVLILDCCFAGRAIETMADSATLVAAETEIYGTHTLASAGPNVPAVAPVGAVHTAFTGSLLSLAREGVENAGPLLSLDVLFRELVARQRRGGFPVPTQRGTDTTLHLALFRNQADVADQMVSVDEAGTVDQPEPPVDLRLELQLALDRIRGFEVELKARMVTYVLSQASALKWTPDNGLAALHVRHRRRLDSFLQEVAVWLASSREAVRPLLDGVADDDPAVEHLRGLHREYLEGLEQWVMVRRSRAATLTTDISASVLSQSEFRSLLTAYFDTEYGDLHRIREDLPMTWIAPAVERPDGSLVAPERELLQGYLNFYRSTLLFKCAGLTAAQLAERPSPPSNLSLLGLIRHLTKVERIWFRIHFADEPAEPVFPPALGKDADFEMIDAAEAQSAYGGLIAEWKLSDEAAAGRSLDDRFTFGGTESTLRMIYIHLIGEYARHCGHADLVREQLDGTTGA